MPITREPEQPMPIRLAEAYRSQEPDLRKLPSRQDRHERSTVPENQSPITREILESFLACKTKAYLKLHGQRGIKSDFEALSTEIRAELRDRASENLVSRVNPEDVMRGVKITEAVLAKRCSDHPRRNHRVR